MDYHLKLFLQFLVLEALTLRIIPRAKHVIQIEVPPLLINGNVWPVTGNKFVATAILITA